MSKRNGYHAIIWNLLYNVIGEDPDREGLKGTPDRVIRMWKELSRGYHQDPAEILSRTFTDGSCKEMVILRGCEYWSMCEHHLMPFFGSVDIGYIPGGKVVGISKLARLVDCFARRLQIQERMTSQIADAIVEHLEPAGVMVVVSGTHLCMRARGVEKQNSDMVTSAIRGVFNEPDARAEFMVLVGRS